MISTELTRLLDIRRPIISAPMAGWSGGELAGAVSAAGAFGMIAAGGSAEVAWIPSQADIARRRGPFGFGLMSWSLESRPELLDAVLDTRPAVVSLSFGDPAPYVGKARDAGAVVMSQVQNSGHARRAVEAGVDVLVAQGTDAGGHTGSVGTMPLLQMALEIGDEAGVPVLAAGGIATGRGLAGVLAMGAAGAWIGTRFCATKESLGSEAAKKRLLETSETGTVHTRVFDLAQGIPWPEEFPGRAIANNFTGRWHGREDALAASVSEAREGLREAREREDFSENYIYAGQAVGMVSDVPSAGELVERLSSEAEEHLRRGVALLEKPR